LRTGTAFEITLGRADHKKTREAALRLRHLFQTLQEGWRIILIISLGAAAISLFLSLSATPIFRSEASFIVFPDPGLTSSRDVVSSLDALEQRTIISTYADILNSRRVYEDTITSLNLDPGVMDQYPVTTVVEQDSNLLVLYTEGPDPDRGSLLANTIGQTGTSLINSIYQVYDIAILDRATIPAEPFSPRPIRDLSIYLGAGLLLGLLLVLVSAQIREPLEALRERLVTDNESGAYSRSHVERTLEKEYARSEVSLFSLGILELEGLFDLVDLLPGSILSDLLSDITEILREQVRGNDMIGRWNRTSFLIILRSTPPDPAVRTLERIRLLLTEPVELESGDKVSLSPIVGVSSSQMSDHPDILILQVEEALKHAKQSDNKTVLFEGLFEEDLN
jgi:diguanylate cyclase (GGDEF)-like protein